LKFLKSYILIAKINKRILNNFKFFLVVTPFYLQCDYLEKIQ
jgi:hypothetical protein